MKANYLLFGCDICQIVCPKNINKGTKMHHEFELNGKEKVSIEDLFMMSEKAFKQKYSEMSYLWKGKTVLMRNALSLMYRYNMKQYQDMVLNSMSKLQVDWYQETAIKVLEYLKKEHR